MLLEGKTLSPVSWTWEEGRYWDLWMLTHFLSGAIIGFLTHFFLFPFWTAFGIFVFLVVSFEIVEILLSIGETIENRILDIIISIPAFLIFYLFLPNFLDYEALLSVGVTIIVANTVLVFFGWHAYIRREQLESTRRALSHIKRKAWIYRKAKGVKKGV